MRALPLAVGISAALHAAAFAWATLSHPVPHPVPVPVPVPAPDPAAVPDPILAVALLDDDTTSQIRSLPETEVAEVSHATSRGSARIVAAHSGRTEQPGTGAGTGTGTGKGHSLMSMRGPEITTGFSGDFIGNFLANSRPLEPGPPPPTGELHPSGNGTFVGVVGGDIDHPKDGVATMRVARDGTVKIDDSPDVTMHWVKPLPFFAGKMAFDDAIMRHYGIDPYSAAKLQWLDKTRDERVRIGTEYRKEVLAHADQYMKQNLDAMWAATATVGAAQRKRLLFMMWDEIAETGDDALVQAGVAARSYLVGFARAHFPQASADAFTPDELAQLNAHRTSKATFAPYE